MKRHGETLNAHPNAHFGKSKTMVTGKSRGCQDSGRRLGSRPQRIFREVKTLDMVL